MTSKDLVAFMSDLRALLADHKVVRMYPSPGEGIVVVTKDNHIYGLLYEGRWLRRFPKARKVEAEEARDG